MNTLKITEKKINKLYIDINDVDINSIKVIYDIDDEKFNVEYNCKPVVFLVKDMIYRHSQIISERGFVEFPRDKIIEIMKNIENKLSNLCDVLGYEYVPPEYSNIMYFGFSISTYEYKMLLHMSEFIPKQYKLEYLLQNPINSFNISSSFIVNMITVNKEKYSYKKEKPVCGKVTLHFDDSYRYYDKDGFETDEDSTDISDIKTEPYLPTPIKSNISDAPIDIKTLNKQSDELDTSIEKLSEKRNELKKQIDILDEKISQLCERASKVINAQIEQKENDNAQS